MNLSIRGKIALLITTIPFIGILIVVFTISLILLIVSKTSEFLGITESLKFLFYISRKKVISYQFKTLLKK